MRRGTDWCETCSGQGFVTEFDRPWSPAERLRLFREGRTAICPKCGGSGRQRRLRGEDPLRRLRREQFQTFLVFLFIAVFAIGFIANLVAWIFTMVLA